jgi:hypothetical protein
MGKASAGSVLPPIIIVWMHPHIRRDLALLGQVDMCTRGAYRGVRHDRHLSAASTELKGMKAAIPTALDDASQKNLDKLNDAKPGILRQNTIRCRSARTRTQRPLRRYAKGAEMIRN